MQVAARCLVVLTLASWVPVSASTCQPEDVDLFLSCGASILDTTVGASAVLADYPCGIPFDGLVQEGPERIYEFTPQLTGDVEILLDNLTTDHDLYVIESCDTSTCIAGSTSGGTAAESVTFVAVAGTTYQIVVEAFSELGSFSLSIEVGSGGCAEDCNDGIDNDDDGDIDCDDSDCDDDSGVYAIPEFVTGLSVEPIGGGHRYAWDDQAASAGPATRYDVFAGELADLDFPGISAGACLDEDLAGPSFDDFQTPLAGTGLYFLVRGENACGVGGYGSVARDAGVAASVTPCLP